MHRGDDEGMTSEILRKVSTLNDIDDSMSDRVLLWAQNGGTEGVERSTKQQKRGQKN